MLTNDQYAAYRAIETIRCPRCKGSHITYYFPPDTDDEAHECMDCGLRWWDTVQVTGYEVLN